jgi:hypothetical protein
VRVLSINYDLYKEPSRQYEKLIAVIKQFAWCHVSESTWLIATELSSHEVRRRLDSQLHPRDKVFIAPVTPGEWSSRGMSQEILAWLHEQLHTVPVTVVRVHCKGVTAARMWARNGGGPITLWRTVIPVIPYSQWRLLRC